MARLTYAALALALAALVAGFFVRTSAVPLFASIGLSALVLVLILRGWARRVRTAREGGDEYEAPEIEELEAAEMVIVEDEDETAAYRPPRTATARPAAVRPKPTRATPPRKPRAARPPRARRELPTTVGSNRVVILPGRTRYHAPGCRFASGKGAREVTEATARRRRYEPCSVCLG